jgi:alpha-D-ribose 1-methylphosphonate 5-triphosphate synthase subunit PhnI
MTEPEPKIDLTKIAFPSDKLTVKMLRTACPEGFDVDCPKDSLALADRKDRGYYDRRSFDEFLGMGLIDIERLVAERAFKVSLGQSIQGDGRLSNRDELIDCLVGEYKDYYGLARGEHEALAMIRNIEAQAEDQARQHPGRPR